MRSLSLVCVLLLITPLAMAQPAPKLDERAAKKLVEEYVAKDTTEERRKEVLASLKAGSPVLAQRTLKALLTDTEKRAPALELAVGLRVPGLFDTAKKFIDTEDEERIVALGCTTQDKGAVEFLVARWKAATTDSASFTFLEKAFCTTSVPWLAIVDFKPALSGDDEGRKNSAVKILGFQLGTAAQTAAWLVQKWSDLEADYKRDSAMFPLKGEDLFQNPDCKGSAGCIRVARNFRLPAKATLSVPCSDEWNQGKFSVTVRIRVNSGTGARAAIRTEHGWWFATFTGSEWTTKSGEQVEFGVPGKAAQWTEIVFAVTDESTPTARFQRHCKVTIDGKVLMEKGMMNGKFVGLEFAAGESTAAVSSADYVRS